MSRVVRGSVDGAGCFLCFLLLFFFSFHSDAYPAASAYYDTVQKTYIGYYQRPADPAGLIYWAGRLDATGGNLSEIINAFATSAEAQGLYGTIGSGNISTVVNDIYRALLNRDADQGGRDYYVEGFNAGRFTAATIMLNILYGATGGVDLQSVNNKLAGANLFTRAIDPELDGLNLQVTYAGEGDAIAGRNFLTLYATPTSVPTQADTMAYIRSNIANPGDAIMTVVNGTPTVLKFRLPDTGQSGSFTSAPGEDSDFIINPQSFTDNGDGTVTDNITGLMWQKTDGGEMTFEDASVYCNNLILGGKDDWRLPTGVELFSINSYDFQKPAINTDYFTKTLAEYWWTSEVRADDATRVWVVNAGGGIGAHPKSETASAGGAKKIHVRAVRNPITTEFSGAHFTDNGNETITDHYTGLVWQKIQSPNTMTWEEALRYSDGFTLAGKSDWRLPNIKELQSLNDTGSVKPSFDKSFFTNITSGNFWSSTTLQSTSLRAWDINVEYGIVSYNDKTMKQNVLLVRGGLDNSDEMDKNSLSTVGVCRGGFCF